MIVGIRRYGLRWRMEPDKPWLLVHGEQVGGDWVHMTREDMLVLWRSGNSVAEINQYMADRLRKEAYSRVAEKFSEIDLM